MKIIQKILKVNKESIVIALFIIILISIQISTFLKASYLLKDGYYSITESIKIKKDRFGTVYDYTFKTKDGEYRKGSFFRSFFSNDEEIDVEKRYIVVYSISKKYTNTI